MGFIKNLSVKLKITVIVAPLVVTLLYLTTYILINRYEEKNNIERVISAAELGLLLNHALHELQAERSYAVSSSLNKKDELAKRQLFDQFKKTDQKLTLLNDRIASTEVSTFTNRFQDAIRTLKEQASELTNIRNTALNDEVSGQNLISLYSDINRSFIAFFEVLVSQSKNDIISKRLSTALNFSKSKDLAGKERALLNSAFAKKKLYADEHKQFVFNIAEQNSYLDVFLVTAKEDEVDYYVNKLEDKSILLVDGYREQVMDNLVFLSKIDPKEWERAISGKINLLKDVEDYLNMNIKKESEELISAANSSFNFFLIFTLILLLGLSFIIHRVVKIILESIDKLNKAAFEISNGNTDIRLDLDINDELGSLANSFNKMAESIESKINDLNVERDLAERIAEENSRIKVALDNTSTNILVTNTENEVTYYNNAAYGMFKDLQVDISSVIEGFSNESLAGQKVERFYLSSDDHIDKIRNLEETFVTQLVFGSKILEFTANPVFDSDEQKLGVVLEILDLTDELEEINRKEIAEREIRIESITNLRIKNALDNASSSVVVADTEGQIIYLNKAFRKMFSVNEDSVRIDLPNFKIDEVLGSSFDDYHKNPNHQKELLKNLTANHKQEFAIADRNYTIVANPVFDETGERLGTVVEWSDNTEELIAQDEVNEVINYAKEGYIDKRIRTGNKEGFIKKIAEGINQLLDAVVEPIRESVPVLQALSEGDLTLEIKSEFKGEHGKIKDGLNKTIHNLNDLMEQINTNVNQVTMGANQVAQTSNSLSKGAQEQSSAIEEISSTIVELTSQTNQNAENAVQANQLSETVKKDADTGVGKMKEMLSSMKEISESSENIGKIIKVIDEIAFQTNLLALNAAVEAARAGQHGKGFAVVADEVRNLAQRSANAAKETTDLIETSMKRVELGSEIAASTDTALSAIVQGVSKVSDFVGEISAASAEQKNGIEQVNRAINSIDKITQSNSAGAEEGAAASEELAAQASEVQNLISQFKLKNTGKESFAQKRATYDYDTNMRQLQNFKKAKEESNKQPNPKDVISLDDVDFGDF
jgi:methyl-accepting chemotaxis protein